MINCWFLFALLLLSVDSLVKDCEYYYSAWGPCDHGIQNRSVLCVCDGDVDDFTSCAEENLDQPLARPCGPSLISCRWRWTLWTACTSPCDGGNATRAQVCMCDGLFTSVPDDFCDESQRFGEELAPCNSFSCDGIPAQTKYYWMERAEEGAWPLGEGVFNCSRGDWMNASSPKGLSYTQVLLSDNLGPPQWLFLAKEWISAKLNLAIGVQFSSDDITLMERTEGLLEQCDSWEGKEFYYVMVAKEKLGRLNNNIGGLEHVEEQMAIIVQFDGLEEGAGLSNALVLMVAVGIAIYIMFWIIVAIKK